MMHHRLIATTACIALTLTVACAQARPPPPGPPDLFSELQPLVRDLPRYNYLVATIPSLTGSERSMARQLLASCENELGLYSEAVRDFPLHSLLPEKLTLPDAAHWQAVDAVDAIADLASDRRLVMINEAHHDGHTRELTLLLLPRLRALGFKYFAAEALDERDASLMQRGIPVTTSGSEYLHDPMYGEIIREAIRLGYIIVPYDAVGSTPQKRENGQARNLYERVFAKDSHAKLFVHAGYAHIDKHRGRLGAVKPMAMALHKLSGIESLSIDQTDIRENPRSEAEAHRTLERALRRSETMMHPIQSPFGSGPGDRPRRPVRDTYEWIVAAFHPARPVILRQTDNHAPWSARPGTYDANVILPPANSTPSDYRGGPVWLIIDGKKHAAMPPANQGHRPDWLALGGKRVAVPVDSRHCARKFPCLVEAHYASEPIDAIAADRYLFLQKAKNVLYLRPGSYRLRTVDADGRTLNEHEISAGNH